MPLNTTWRRHLAVIAACALSLPAWSEPLISVVPSSSSSPPATSFTVDAQISGVTDLYGYQFDLSYNPNVLQATSVTEGPFLAGGESTFFVPGTIDNTGGNVFATADTLVGAVPGVSGSGILAVFDFTTIGPGISPLNLENVVTLDSNLNSLSVSTSNSSVLVPGTVSAPEIDPRGAAAALTLLLGMLVVIYERKRESSG